jgi:sulfur carrier protein
VQVLVNGKLTSLAGVGTVRDLLGRLELQGRVAVEINERIVPRSEFESHPVRDGDRIEIVQAIGGG